MGKSGEAFAAGLHRARGVPGEKGAEAGEAVLPALTARGAQVGEVRVPVMGLRVGRAGDSAEKIEVDTVHGFRPVSGECFRNAMKRGMIRIRKIHGT